jgi:hypothetical protein
MTPVVSLLLLTSMSLIAAGFGLLFTTRHDELRELSPAELSTSAPVARGCWGARAGDDGPPRRAGASAAIVGSARGDVRDGRDQRRAHAVRRVRRGPVPQRAGAHADAALLANGSRQAGHRGAAALAVVAAAALVAVDLPGLTRAPRAALAGAREGALGRGRGEGVGERAVALGRAEGGSLVGGRRGRGYVGRAGFGRGIVRAIGPVRVDLDRRLRRGGRRRRTAELREREQQERERQATGGHAGG